MPRAGTTIVNNSSGLVGQIISHSGQNPPNGWLLCDGKTIGNALSGATSRANDDTKSLFKHLWDNFDNAQLAVSGGRGVSAEVDFAANKTIVLPDLRGRTIVGRDNMGGSAANRMTSSGSGIDGTTHGASGGAETHTLSVAQMPAHDHDQFTRASSGAGGAPVISSSNTANTYSDTVSIQNRGGGGAHQNTQPSYVLTKIIKL